MADINKSKTISKFVEEVQAGGRLFFSTDEIGPRATGSRAVEAALRRYGRNGAIRRLSRKSTAFVIVPPEHRSMGLPPVEWWLNDLMAHLRKPYYLGLLSAAATEGSSHFAVMETQVITTAWMRPIETGRLRIRFFQKTAIPAGLIETTQNQWSALSISKPALTACDLVRYRVCSFGQTSLVLADLTSKISRSDLRAALDAGNDPPSAQRLGALFEAIGATKLADETTRWLAVRTIRAIDLEPGGGPGRLSERWQVRMNADLEANA
jgi:hypothetical protein